jgi:hypothetical protein
MNKYARNVGQGRGDIPVRAILGLGLIVALAMESGVACTRATADHHQATIATGGPTTVAMIARSPQESDTAVPEVPVPQEIGPDCNTNYK